MTKGRRSRSSISGLRPVFSKDPFDRKTMPDTSRKRLLLRDLDDCVIELPDGHEIYRRRILQAFFRENRYVGPDHTHRDARV